MSRVAQLCPARPSPPLPKKPPAVDNRLPAPLVDVLPASCRLGRSRQATPAGRSGRQFAIAGQPCPAAPRGGLTITTEDRTSGGEGERVAVSVDLCGRRIHKNNKTQ